MNLRAKPLQMPDSGVDVGEHGRVRRILPGAVGKLSRTARLAIQTLREPSNGFGEIRARLDNHGVLMDVQAAAITVVPPEARRPLAPAVRAKIREDG